MSQDMPPPGGFSTIHVERILPKPLVRQGTFAAFAVVSCVIGYQLIREAMKIARVHKVEQVEHYIAAQPFLVAEQERKYLLHLKNLRAEEKELMKNVPEWQFGTLYGEPVFKKLPKNTLPPIDDFDWTAHNSFKEFEEKCVRVL